ncbi:MAG: carbohydrate kinase family protein [Ruminococcaceae bacterium]|nr:carbohydrate kinase family protein [Oscillospiraceae bacterium]
MQSKDNTDVFNIDYIITGYVIVNNIHFNNGENIENLMGGSSVYAYSGVKMLTDNCIMVAGIGEDFFDYYSDWVKHNNVDMRGLLVVDKHTCNTTLVYRENGEYRDVSKYIPEKPIHSDEFNFNGSHLSPFINSAKGLYVFASTIENFNLAAQKEKNSSLKIMWEYPSMNTYNLKENLSEYLEYVDIFSINRPESFRLFGIEDIDRIVELLKDTGKPCYYRLGEDGGCIITPDGHYFVSAVKPYNRASVDPTGCGNSSVSAMMWAFCEGLNPVKALFYANTVAGFNSMQYGPFFDLGESAKRSIVEVAENLYKKEVLANPDKINFGW